VSADQEDWSNKGKRNKEKKKMKKRAEIQISVHFRNYPATSIESFNETVLSIDLRLNVVSPSLYLFVFFSNAL